jgi:5-methyltetrahydrofolate--homocysteine methyltransferase
LIGTVAGDIHDIGKDIVTFMLDVSGYDVLDLGIDVPISTFVEKTREFQPRVLGLSGFLTLAFDSMKKTVEALEQAGLRDKVKIMIGGGQIDDEVRSYARADAYGKDAVAAVNLCRQWIGG